MQGHPQRRSPRREAGRADKEAGRKEKRFLIA
nr:MAG TPA: hypothetical protein [Caudoviricetes sp.]